MLDEFRAILKADQSVVSLSAGNINWAAQPPRKKWPGVVLHLIGNLDGLHLKGRDGLFDGRVQVNAVADTHRNAQLLSQAIEDLLHGYRGGGFRLIEGEGGARSGREGGGNEADRPYYFQSDYLTHWRAE